MQFSVFAVATLPDITTARRLHGLEDLDDAGVVKVMQHQARQRGYPPDVLAPEQQRIAALTLIDATPEALRIDTLTDAHAAEQQMLAALCTAVAEHRPLLYWGADLQTLRIVDNRLYLHAIVSAAYWAARTQRQKDLVDLGSWLRGDSATCRDLDELARATGLPGLMGLRCEAVVRPDTASRADTDLAPHSEVQAMNLLLIGARRFLIGGDATQADVERLESDLKAILAAGPQPHRVAFLERWGGQ